MFLIGLFAAWAVTGVTNNSPPSTAAPAGAVAPEAAGPFQDLPFEAALKQARTEHKVVFIDFFTTWCGPCKRLDATTWRDPGVIALLKDKTIALRLDAEKNPDLAKRYSVNAYPTMALIDPDGTLRDTLVGYMDAPKFTADFNDSLAGKTSLTRAQDAVDAAKAGGGSAYVQARYHLGQELANKGKNAEALAEYLWCFDDGMKNIASYSGVRVSFLLNDVDHLAHRYPPALDALKARRDEALKALEASPSDFHAAQDYASLNHYLDDDKATLAYFDKLPADSPARRAMGYSVFDLLLEAKRYGDALGVQPYAQYKSRLAGEALAQLLLPKEHLALLRDVESEFSAKEVEALAGAGQLDDARDLIKIIFATNSSPKARDAVSQHLARAGHPELLPPPK